VSSVTVAVVGAREIAASLGKKGTQSDITLFNSVRDGHATTLIEPTQYPEKFPPLLSAVAMADRVVFVVPGLNREVAEVAATLDVLAPDCVIRYGETVGEGELRRVLKGNRLESAPLARFNLQGLREELDGWASRAPSGPVQVRIDHAFPVKGVGAVALGLVRRGTVRAHDSLRLFPTERTVEIRSLQVHDADVKEAPAGSRVGLALKGVEAEELGRGQTLAAPGTMTVATSAEVSNWQVSRYYRGTPAAGQSVHALVGLQFVPARWSRLDGPAGALEFDRPVAWEKGDAVALAELSVVAGPRSIGRATLG
jgi:selenocysteine-specific translation elongation factor